MTRIKQGLIKMLDAATVTGPGVPLDVSNYRTIVFQLFTSGSANVTVKFAASMSLQKPDFSIAASATNVYDFMQVNWLNNDSSVPGATGVVVAGTDTIKLFEVNTNLIKWFCPIVTAHSAGAVSVEMDAANNYTR